MGVAVGVDDGDGVVEGERENGLVLAECEGLPRQMLESGISDHVFERMNFLWRASNCLRLSSPAVSRIYSDQLRKLCAEHATQLPAAAAGGNASLLPEWVSGSLCVSCGCILTPGLTCRVRIRHRSLASPSVRKSLTKVGGKKKKKCLNEVVTSCLMCGGVNTRGGAEREARDKKRRRRARGSGGHVADIAEAERETPKGKKRSRIATNLRGNLIPLGEGGGFSRASSTPRTTPVQQKNPRNLSPRASAAAAAPPSSSKSNRSSSRKGDNSIGVQTPARPGRPAAAKEGTGASRRGSERGGGGGVSVGRNGRSRSSIGSVSGTTGEGGGAGHVEQPPAALSLLERIRRDAKKKRRQGAAAASAAAK